jgi:hypothetical protein
LVPGSNDPGLLPTPNERTQFGNSLLPNSIHNRYRTILIFFQLIHRILEILNRGNLSLKKLWQFKCVLIGRNADRLVRVAQGILDCSFSFTLAQNQTDAWSVTFTPQQLISADR